MIFYPDNPEANTPAIDGEKVERYPNLRAAGQQLALQLQAFRHSPDVVVIGIARGGIPVADEVAKSLCAQFDVIIVRRLLTPQGPGSQVCAANVAGHTVLPNEILPLAETPATPLDYFIADALNGLRQRAEISRREHPPADLAGKTVLLVDCGMKTAMTMQAAIDALRSRHPRRLIAAVPVASKGSLQALRDADEIVCLASPEPFAHVGLWYHDFTRPGDEAIAELIGSRYLD